MGQNGSRLRQRATEGDWRHKSLIRLRFRLSCAIWNDEMRNIETASELPLTSNP